jgi:hypothetical protein
LPLSGRKNRPVRSLLEDHIRPPGNAGPFFVE